MLGRKSPILASPTDDPGNVFVQSLAQFDGSLEKRQASDSSVQIELVASRPALEALEGVRLQVGREGTAPLGGRAMNRTRAAHLAARGERGNEPKQLQNLRQRDQGSDLVEVDARHRVVRG